MTAQVIFEQLLSGAKEILSPTCDRRIVGDPNKEVKKIGVCFKLTAALIRQAMEQGIDLIITHEPTFSQSDKRENATALDMKKWALLEESGLTVYRFHDHAHHRAADYIHEGFLQALELKIRHKYPNDSIGICRYELDEPLTTRQLAERIRARLGIEFVRIVGRDDFPLRTIGLGLGCVGIDQVKILFEPAEIPPDPGALWLRVCGDAPAGGGDGQNLWKCRVFGRRRNISRIKKVDAPGSVYFFAYSSISRVATTAAQRGHRPSALACRECIQQRGHFSPLASETPTVRLG